MDPTPLWPPLILFYGLMMADMGYGLIMVIAALVAMKKIKPRRGTLSFCQLLLYGGISTFVMGALTGGFFGNALEQIGIILNLGEGWGVLPALFNPMTDSMMVLIGAMVLGLIHLNTGMVINFVKKTKRGQLSDAIWEEGALWVTLIGGVLLALGFGNVAGVPVVLVIGLLMVFYGGSRSAKGFGKLLSVFTTLSNTATGLVRQHLVLLPYHGFDACRLRYSNGVQHHRRHRQQHRVLRRHLYHRPQLELCTEPAGLLCPRPASPVPGVFRQVL
ncbi:MAG: hypothetical protein V8T45_06800 [Oscillospiraceae bacterium]